MGLFGKKIDACIAFVGKYEDLIPPEEEYKYAQSYRSHLARLTAQNCGGMPVVAWFFSDWSQHVYSTQTLTELRTRGFAPGDTGEKRQLFEEMVAIVAFRHKIQMMDYNPICLVDGDGIFVILCRVKGKAENLGL